MLKKLFSKVFKKKKSENNALKDQCYVDGTKIKGDTNSKLTIINCASDITAGVINARILLTSYDPVDDKKTNKHLMIAKRTKNRRIKNKNEKMASRLEKS